MVHLKQLGNISPHVKRICQKQWIRSANSGNKNFSARTYSSSGVIRPDFIVQSAHPNFKAVTGVTIPELVWSDLGLKENAPALECAETGQKLTHGDVYRQSRSFAAALIQSGVKSRDIITVCCPNIPQYAPVLFGIWEVGAIASPVNPAYTEEEIIRQIKMSEAKVIITTPPFLAAIRAAKKACSSVKSIIVIGEAHEGCHTYNEMIKQDPTGVDFFKGSEVDTTQEISILPFSSGTTGPPKGVELTISNICSNLLQFTTPDVSIFRKLGAGNEQERLIGILPFYHSYGLTALVITNNLLGSNLLCIPKFKPESFVKYIKYFRPTTLTLVTPIIAFLAHTPLLTTKDFESVGCVQAGAAPVGVNLINKLLEKAGKYIFFQEMYGLTELSPASHVMNPSKGNTKLGSCGTVIPGTLGKVVDLESAKCLGPNEKGEICVKGPQVMNGYFKNEEATRNCIDSDGWFHTGDIGYYDEDGCFYIVDRLKELIKVKGLQVAPAELEDILRQIPDVADVAVIGVPHEMNGESPRAYIVRKSDTLSENSIHTFLHGKISKHKELTGGIEFVSIIPKAASGKILRRELKADYLSKHAKK